MTDDEESKRMDAAEYALGTLTGVDRSRFETRLMHDGAARDELAYWEHRLGALGFALAPVDPPSAVWSDISRRLSLQSTTAFEQRPAVSAPRPAANDSRFWRGATVAASLAALLMGGLWIDQTLDSRAAPPVIQPSHAFTSIVHDQASGTAWLVTADEQGESMHVVATRDFDVPAGKVLKAWLQPADGNAMLLGDWPATEGGHEMALPQAAGAQMQAPADLLVSLEDAPGNAPTAVGRVMWQAPIVRSAG